MKRHRTSAERTSASVLRYVIDNPEATCADAACDLGMSFANVSRLVASFKGSGILVGGAYKQTGKRGPWSQVVSLRADLGCSVGVDLEATHVRGVILDFANNVTGVLRAPVAPTAGAEEIVAAVSGVAGSLVRKARKQNLAVCAVGLALPGPVIDVKRGLVRTELQFGETTLEFVPSVEHLEVPATAAANSYCFAAAHHRMHSPRSAGVETVILNRFGLAAAVLWNGQTYTGASHSAGELGLLPCCTVSPLRRYHDVCTGAALLRLARLRGSNASFQELLESPGDPVVREWLLEAVPAFAQAIYTALIAYNPDRLLIEGIFNRFPGEVRRRIASIVTDELAANGNMLPEIRFFEGDDLMGARGSALLARDNVVEGAIARIIETSGDVTKR